MKDFVNELEGPGADRPALGEPAFAGVGAGDIQTPIGHPVASTWLSIIALLEIRSPFVLISLDGEESRPTERM